MVNRVRGSPYVKWLASLDQPQAHTVVFIIINRPGTTYTAAVVVQFHLVDTPLGWHSELPTINRSSHIYKYVYI